MEIFASSPTSKVAFIGAGYVGSTAAYALMLDGSVGEIVLIDSDKGRAEGEALDLNHCMQFTKGTNVSAGDSFELVQGADIVVICAGSRQKIVEKREDLVLKNAEIFTAIIPKIIQHNKSCILLVVTNPVDVMTYLAWQLSGFSRCSVFGTGTVLDTARLRYLLGSHFQVSPKDITAYVLGEHGDSEFVWWSQANIAGIPLKDFENYNELVMNDIYEKTRNAAYNIIQKKGATCYAIGLVIVKIIRSLLLNQPRVFTVSRIMQEIVGVKDVALSLPTIIRRQGICQELPLILSDAERVLLYKSACVIKKNISNC